MPRYVVFKEMLYTTLLKRYSKILTALAKRPIDTETPEILKELAQFHTWIAESCDRKVEDIRVEFEERLLKVTLRITNQGPYGSEMDINYDSSFFKGNFERYYEFIITTLKCHSNLTEFSSRFPTIDTYPDKSHQILRVLPHIHLQKLSIFLEHKSNNFFWDLFGIFTPVSIN